MSDTQVLAGFVMVCVLLLIVVVILAGRLYRVSDDRDLYRWLAVALYEDAHAAGVGFSWEREQDVRRWLGSKVAKPHVQG